jgi:uncharacterized membrane protein
LNGRGVTILQPLLPAASAFLASLVEFVEALTIVLAVGATRGWRPAVLGALGGTALLLVLVVAFGGSLAHVPERTLALVVGGLLLLFGMRWLRKACLRATGALALHDEGRAFDRARDALRRDSSTPGLDWSGLVTALNAVVLEGIEVVFIVLALGSRGHAFAPVVGGAATAFVAVAALGVAVHRPLARVPENALKLAVGVMLSAFGTLWIGEAFAVEWPGRDLSLLALVAGYGVAAGLATAVARARAGPT